MNIDDDQWPLTDSGRKLEILQEACQCEICAEMYDNPQFLRCGHSFCSLCIRKHILLKHDCPFCHENISVQDLQSNRVLASIVNAFRDARSQLIQASSPQESTIACDNTKSATKQRKRGRDGHKQASTPHEVRKMPLLNYHGMKDKGLKDALKRLDEGSCVKLNYTGTKDVLIRRHKEFVHLNNAQIGHPTPLSLEAMVRQVNERERNRAKSEIRSKSKAHTVNKLMTGTVTKVAKSGFLSLMSKIRERKQGAVMNSGSEKSGEQSAPLSVDRAVESSRIVTAAAKPTRTDAKGTEEEATSPAIVTYTWGHWRIVLSESFGLPFYFNERTRMGQFQTPSDMVEGAEARLLDEIGGGTSRRTTRSSSSSSSSSPFHGEETPASDEADAEMKHDEDGSTQGRCAPPGSLDLTGTTLKSPSGTDRGSGGGVQVEVEGALSQGSPAQLTQQTLILASQSTQQIETNWKCPKCTLINSAANNHCEVCENKRPQPRRACLSQAVMGTAGRNSQTKRSCTRR